MSGYEAPGGYTPGTTPDFPTAYEPIITERFGTRGWTAASDDAAPGAHIRGGLLPMIIDRKIGLTPKRLLGGVIVRQAGTIEVDNTSGRLDALRDSRIWEGRPCRLKIASRRAGTRPRTQKMALMWSGLIDKALFGTGKVQFWTKDLLSAMDRPISQGAYTGNGGIGGFATLTGKSRPIGLGYIFNARTELIDQDNRIHQISFRLVREIVSVRDMGARLTFERDVDTYEALVALEVPLGGYGTCRRLGLIKTGDYPNGDLTCDFYGDGEDPAAASGVWDDTKLPWDDDFYWDDRYQTVFVSTAAGLIKRLLEFAGLTETYWNKPLFAAVDRSWPYPMALHVEAGAGEGTILEYANEICEAAGMILVVDRDNLISLRRLDMPTGGIRIGPEHIESLEAIDPPFETPISSFTVPYGRNAYVQAASDLVRPDDEFYSEAALAPYQRPYEGVGEYISQSTQRLVKHARAVQLPNAYYTTHEGAFARAKDGVFLHKAGRIAFQVKSRRRGWRLDLGRSIVLEYPRLGLEAGRPMLVTGLQDNTNERQIVMDVMG